MLTFYIMVKGCTFLDGFMTFMFDGINLCYKVSHVGGGNISVVKYDENAPEQFKFDVEDYISSKKEVISYLMNNQVHPRCVGCVEFDKMEVDSNNFKLKSFVLHHWTKCNCNCIYCYTNDDKKYYNSRKSYDVLPIFKQLINKKMFEYQGIVNFAGGEVSCLRNFKKIMDILLKYDYFFFFNSSAIQYEKSIEKTLKSSSAFLIVSVDAGTEKTHKKIKRVNVYKKVMANLKRYVSSSGFNDNVFLKYIFVHNYNDSEKEVLLFIKKSKKIGVQTVLFDIDYNYLVKNRENMDQKIIDLFYYAKSKCEDLNLNMYIYDNAVSVFCSEESKYSDLKTWKEYVFSFSPRSLPKYKNVVRLDANKNKRVYGSIVEASKDTGIDYMKIKRACTCSKYKIPAIVSNNLFVYENDYVESMEKIFEKKIKLFL